MIPVALSDVAMAIHALLLTLFAMFQVAIYEVMYSIILDQVYNLSVISIFSNF